MATFVILPTFNEKKNLAGLVEEIFYYLPDTQILVVDDNSPDGTGELAENLKNSYPNRLHVIHRKQREGLGRAYLEGYQFVLKNGAEKIIQMDADHSHPPALLPKLVAGADEYDLVLGSRYIKGGGTEGWSFWRKILSRSANLYARILLGLNVRDVTAGFRCFNRRVFSSLDLFEIKSRGYAFQVEMVYQTLKAGFSVGEIPFIFKDRVAGKSKMGLGLALEGFLIVLKMRLKIRSSKSLI